MTKKFFGDRFANGLPRDQVDAHYARYVVPTAGKVYWDGMHLWRRWLHYLEKRRLAHRCS